MTSKTYKIAVSLILLAALHVFLFVTVRKTFTVFWISYVFLMIAWVLSIVLVIFDVVREKRIFGYSLAAVTACYLVAATGAAFFCIFKLRYFKVLCFLLQLVILTVYLVCYLSVKKVNTDIKTREAERAKDMAVFGSIKDSAAEVLNRVEYTAPWRKQVEKALDAVSSGQVKSSPEALETEQKLLTAIGALGSAVDLKDEETILSSCREIERLSEERRRILMSSRSRF